MATRTQKIKQSPKLPAETRREQLLSAAQVLFVKKGFTGTTIDEVARKAGLTKGAVYFHFRNKEDILLGLVKLFVEKSHTAIEARSDRKLSPVELFELQMERHQSCLGARQRDVVDIWVQALRIPRIRQYATRRMRKTVSLSADLLDPRYGRTRREREDIAVFILSLFHGLAAESLMNPSLINMENQIRLLRRLFVPKGRSAGSKKGK